jgi:hypothetical protein
MCIEEITAEESNSWHQLDTSSCPFPCSFLRKGRERGWERLNQLCSQTCKHGPLRSQKMNLIYFIHFNFTANLPSWHSLNKLKTELVYDIQKLTAATINFLKYLDCSSNNPCVLIDWSKFLSASKHDATNSLKNEVVPRNSYGTWCVRELFSTLKPPTSRCCSRGARISVDSQVQLCLELHTPKSPHLSFGNRN